MEESLRRLVLIDFWPLVRAVQAADADSRKGGRVLRGKVRLAKMNIDAYPQIAEKLGIQSIPAVVAFQNGQMVDGFMARCRKARSSLHRALHRAGPDVEALLAEGRRNSTRRGRFAEAAFAQILGVEPDHAGALAGLAASKSARRAGRSQELLDAIPAAQANAPAVAAARAALALQEQAARWAISPSCWRASKMRRPTTRRATTLPWRSMRGRRDAAAQELLNIVKRDRGWNDDAARKLLLQLFESWGRSTRRRVRPDGNCRPSCSRDRFRHVDEQDLFRSLGPARDDPIFPLTARSCCRAANCRSIFSSRAISRCSTTPCAATDHRHGPAFVGRRCAARRDVAAAPVGAAAGSRNCRKRAMALFRGAQRVARFRILTEIASDEPIGARG